MRNTGSGRTPFAAALMCCDPRTMSQLIRVLGRHLADLAADEGLHSIKRQVRHFLELLKRLGVRVPRERGRVHHRGRTPSAVRGCGGQTRLNVKPSRQHSSHNKLKRCEPVLYRV